MDEKLTCPKCKNKNAEKRHDIRNFALSGNIVLATAFFVIDTPFGPEYRCKDCGYIWR